MRVLIMKKRTLVKIIAFSALFLCCLFVGRYMTDSSVAVLSRNVGMLSPICEVDTLEKKVALTIDTAFGNDRTKEILDILQQNNVSATFCIVGKWAEENTELTGEIYTRGHEIINHSMNHDQYTDMNEIDILADAAAAQEVLKNYTEGEKKFIRVPYNSYNDNVLRSLDEGGYTCIGYSVDAQDWASDDKNKIVENLTKDMKGGDILMMQNNTNSADALGDVIEKYKEKGYEFVVLSQLIPDGDYSVSGDGLLYYDGEENADE